MRYDQRSTEGTQEVLIAWGDSYTRSLTSESVSILQKTVRRGKWVGISYNGISYAWIYANAIAFQIAQEMSTFSKHWPNPSMLNTFRLALPC